MNPKNTQPNSDENPRNTIPEGFGYGEDLGGSGRKQEAVKPTPAPSDEPTPETGDGGRETENPDMFDIEELARETDEKFRGPKEEDKFEDDLGWGIADEADEPESADSEDKGDEPDDKHEAGSGEHGEDDPDGGDSQDDEPTPPDESGTPPKEATDPESDGDSDDEPGEDEPFYDEERDFPDGQAAGTVYKDRVKLNDGVAAKINHARNLKKQLDEMDSGLGAIRLPELFDGQEDYVDRPFDRSQFSDVSDDDAKKAVFELDRFIKDVNKKVANVEKSREQQQQVTQVTEEYRQAVDQLVKDLDVFGMDPNEAASMKVNDILGKIDASIAEFEGDKGRDFVDNNGPKAYNQKMRSFEEARRRIEAFPEVAARQQQLHQKKQGKPAAADPKKVKNSYHEMRDDRADHPVFETKQKEKAFLEWAENEVFQGRSQPAETPREWVNLADAYEAEVQKEYEKYQKAEVKSEKAKENPSASGKRADRSDKKRPPVDKVKTDKKQRDDDRLTIDEIDDDLDRLAKETEARLND